MIAKSTWINFKTKAAGRYFSLRYRFFPKSTVRQVVRLFSTPQIGRLLDFQKEFLEPAKFKEFLVAGNTIVTYHWPGKGKRVLLLHGWESNTHRWNLLLPKLLQEGFDVYAVDAPAHGASGGKTAIVPDYAKVLSAFIPEVEPQFIIGHSMGAMTIIYHLAHQPYDCVEKIVLLAPPAELTIILKEYQNLLGFSDALMAALDQYFKKNYGFTAEEFSMPRFAQKIEVPALLLHSKYDRIVPFVASKSIAAQMPQVDFKLLKEGRHSLYTETADRLILDFIND
ncbi:MAG: alpha/beta fold hydrolase [Flavobacteriaceae bacterium]|nr:alpha/beta fold hydrolase [Flavobacteriaceae bacterium]